MTQTRPLAISVVAVIAVIFGALTILSGGRALFGGVDMGRVVPFVLWFNFFAGFAYVLAGIGLWLRASWGSVLSVALAVATALVFLAFLLHVWRGGGYEIRTMGAMILRTAFWATVALLVWFRRPAV